MIRTQIQLTEEQAQLVKRLASERQVSMAEVIRDSVEQMYRASAHAPTPEDRIRRAVEAAGRFRSGRADGSAEHDTIAAGAYSA
ncbi:MAG: CopG family transcriptional regulator [Candidatus Latescibacteria bacterium]|jgi:hypothetical protein|nr:CopG family transcriptional regulator [Gemmatimonadaceae bacterium]MDP7447729.1 CopG family transcriptional regulator [Candidatus Latescibacterota bacterium]HJP32266.1 CopG family transcriptional regulator [Candidatus Latescibacterota bacterium]|tara:strand:- start:578 stop:829 length:252 start_codon:yes stop_codon:yes gene_type:complete